MEKPKTIYCGGGKKMASDWINVTLHIDKIVDHVFEYNGKKYLKLNVNVREEPDQYGKDVSLSVDQGKKEETEVVQEVVQQPKPENDFPF